MDSILQNRDVLLFLLGLVVKRNGGVLRIPEKEVMTASGADMLTLAYDKSTNTVVLMTIDGNPEDSN